MKENITPKTMIDENVWILSDKQLPPPDKAVLCYDKENGQFIGEYVSAYSVEYDSLEEDRPFDPVEERHGCYYLKEGWYEVVDTSDIMCDYDEYYLKRNVTHWTTLPPIPTTNE